MNGPTDPFSDWAEAAVSQHEMYTSWVEAGFTADQAMELLITVVSEIVRGSISGC